MLGWLFFVVVGTIGVVILTFSPLLYKQHKVKKRAVSAREEIEKSLSRGPAEARQEHLNEKVEEFKGNDVGVFKMSDRDILTFLGYDELSKIHVDEVDWFKGSMVCRVILRVGYTAPEPFLGTSLVYRTTRHIERIDFRQLDRLLDSEVVYLHYGSSFHVVTLDYYEEREIRDIGGKRIEKPVREVDRDGSSFRVAFEDRFEAIPQCDISEDPSLEIDEVCPRD